MPVKSESRTKKSVKSVAAKTPATTAKKRAVKKCAKKADSQCALASNAAASAKSSPSKLTRIIVKYNVGWGNQLYIRGTGAGLTWHKGVLMQCVGEDEWLWEQYVPKGDITFKLLVNDSQWSVGDDFVVSAGESIICRPEF